MGVWLNRVVLVGFGVGVGVLVGVEAGFGVMGGVGSITMSRVGFELE